jgi:creatinine amidohydrolase
VESYLQHDDRIILITGSTEQHAYLSLLTDIEIPVHIANAVAQKTNVLVAPPFNFGVADFFMQYPGTVTLRPSTFSAVLVDIIGSLARHGFKRFLILNGHGGNSRPPELDQFSDLKIQWHNWWNSPVAKHFAHEMGLDLGHANWSENFPFNRVAESPRERKPKVAIDYKDPNADARATLGDGSTGDYYEIADDHMQRFFALVVDEVAALVAAL